MIQLIFSLFLTVAPVGAVTDSQDTVQVGCQGYLIHPSASEVTVGSSLAYTLDNFLGKFELRFQVLPEGTQVVLLPILPRNLTTMQKLLSVSLKHHFGSRYSINKPKRSLSEASRHGWIDVKPSPELGETLLHIINSFSQLPLFKTLTTYGLSQDVNFRRKSERYMQRYFPGVSDVVGMRTMIYSFPFFVERLGVLERLFADDSILSTDDEEPKSDLFLERLAEFLFDQKVNSVEIRRQLRARFHKSLSDILPRNSTKGSSFDWESIKPGPEDELALQTNSQVAVRRIVTASHITTKKVPGKKEVRFNGSLLPEMNGFVEQLELTENEFGSWSLKISDLKLNKVIKQKLSMSGAVYMYELLKFSAKDLVVKFELTREQMLELMDELNVYAFDLHFDGDWDRSNFRLRRDRPEYYEHSHVPIQPWLRWDLIDQDKDKENEIK